MKSRIIKLCLLSLFVTLIAESAEAQSGRASRKKASDQSTDNQTSTQTNANAQTAYDPYGGVPIEKDSTGGGYNDSVIKKSFRPTDAFDKSFVNERTPLPYEHLRWDDALYSEKVWRELDLREKMNQTFRYEAEDDNGGQMFIQILLKAVRRDSIMAFNDDRFTDPITREQLDRMVSGGDPDTVPVYDINDPSKIVKYTVTQKAFDPKTVNKIRIMEQWIVDREASRMFCRIIGIAPLKTVYVPGTTKERGQEVMFWVYYPDLRPILAKYEVYNPKNLGYGRMTWEELFESRMFSSYITKSTLDNPGNKTLKQMFPDNDILRLLEGENIRERIFTFEQDLWSY